MLYRVHSDLREAGISCKIKDLCHYLCEVELLHEPDSSLVTAL